MDDKLTSILKNDFVIYDNLAMPLDGAADELFPILYQLFADIEKITTVVRIVGIKEKYNQIMFDYDEYDATEQEVEEIDKLFQAVQAVTYSEHQKASRQKGKL